MPVSLKKYKQNKEAVLQELEQLNALLNNAFGAYENVGNNATVLEVDKLRDAINYILTDAQKTKEQEEKDREREEKIKQGIDPDKEEKEAEALNAMEDLDDELAGRVKKEREPKPGRYKTNEWELQNQLNELNKMNSVFKLPVKGGKKAGDLVMPDVQARKKIHGIMGSLDEKLGTELAPKKVPGMYYEENLLSDNALSNIDKLKEKFKSPVYDDKNVLGEEKAEMVAAIFASRMTVKSWQRVWR